MSDFRKQLKKLNACGDAVKWVGDRDMQTAWAECERGDWMLWLAAKIGVDRKLLVLAACDCAEPALAYVREGEDRPRIAIETARLWCEGKATNEEVRSAAVAAYAASTAASTAAYAAASTAAYASAVAAVAAAAAADAAAHSASLKLSANKVRGRIPVEVIAALQESSDE